MLLFMWMGTIFLMTTISIPRGQVPHYTNLFHWHPEPDISEFIDPLPALTEEFVIRKVGHILVFFLLAVLFVLAYHSFSIAFFICFFFGFLTEFAQLFFSRGGRLFDVWIDGIGVFIGITCSFLMIQFIEVVKTARKSLKG
jgi:VanZ family protein